MTASILVLALLAVVAVTLWSLHRSGHRVFGLHQFRPAAPLAGILTDGRDFDRELSDLRSMSDARSEIQFSR